MVAMEKNKTKRKKNLMVSLWKGDVTLIENLPKILLGLDSLFYKPPLPPSPPKL